MTNSSDEKISDNPITREPYLLRHPILIVFIALFIYSLGIWNSQEGGAEDTIYIRDAQVMSLHKEFSGNLYTNGYAFILSAIDHDSVDAIVIMKAISSITSSLALYCVLSCFSKYLSKTAILLATFVWISASVNTPIVQSECLPVVTFSVMLFGIYFLLQYRNVTGVIGFYFLAFTAAGLRPEYMAPLLLVTLVFICWLLWRLGDWLEKYVDFTRFASRTACIALVCLSIFSVELCFHSKISEKLKYCDNYLGLGFGQCYAVFYQREHPKEVFQPMTEYQWLIKRDFGNAQTLTKILRKNPTEALRYFFFNTIYNLGQVPVSLLSVRDEESSDKQRKLIGWIFSLGAVFSIPLLFKLKKTWHSILGDPKLSFNLLVLLLLTSSASAAIITLIPLFRYYLSIVPLLYLLLAYCFDRVLIVFCVNRFRSLIILAGGALFCYPHYTFPRPNYEFRTLQHLAPLVKKTPTIMAFWAMPDCIYGFSGDATEISTTDIKIEDIQKGNYDILMIDDTLRTTQIWTSQEPFFKDLEQNPAKYGYTKVIDVPTGRFDVLYRPITSSNLPPH